MPDADNNNDQNAALPGVPPPGGDGPLDIAERPRVGKIPTTILGLALMILFLMTAYYMYALWPVQVKDPSGNMVWARSMALIDGTIESEHRMIVLVLLAALVGSLIHTATSFSNYVGEQKLDKSWIWWYALRPIIGMSVALVFYLVFRAGLLTNTSLETLNVYGIMTLAALSGLFTDKSTLKLQEIFETLFKPKDNRTGKLNTGGGEVAGDDGAQA